MKLTKKQKQKIAIAADVIAQIKARRYVAQTGRYIGGLSLSKEMFGTIVWSPLREKHRKQFNDLDWAAQQPEGVRYFIGDLLEFEAGGFGVIRKINQPANGWPASYATEPVPYEVLPDHPRTKRAWHYELDFKRRIL